jgi:chemotaxis methyl-accepting protein methylase
MMEGSPKPRVLMALPEEKPFEFPVVGIGASAGGILAIQSLLQALGDCRSAAIVIIQHLPPGKPSGFPGLVRKWTPLPVHEDLDGLAPVPGNVYLPPPSDVLTLEAGLFRTRPAAGGQRRPGIDTIDAFFESLAQDRGSNAIAVVLSGTGTDASAGAVRVRQAGGTVLVQEPASAAHEGMPASVIARGVARAVLPIAGIADEILALASPDPARRRASEAWSDTSSHALDEILALIAGRAGLDLASYKSSPVLWRVQQRMDARGSRHFADYEALLRDDPAELERLVKGLPIHVTEFFRDPQAWEVLEQDVIGAPDGERPLRAWTPACATGEEAYSLAMLLAERAAAANAAPDFQVFATDASRAIVARASRGVFAENAMHGISSERRLRFFYAADRSWRVKRSLRERMVFAPHDLLRDPPFGNLDIITCRNLLIYLEPDAIEHVLTVLHGALRTGGCLFLGRGEPLPSRQKGLVPVSTKWHIYRKTNEPLALKAKFTRHLKRARHAALAPAAARPPERRHPNEQAEEAMRVSRNELDASREELEALNEELKASNDQLNLSVEDLAESNVQLREKIAQLEMQSRVLSSGSVATVFLDNEKRIRWFTPAIAELFPLADGDRGRPLTDLAPRFADPAFFDDVDAVMRTGEPREAEVAGKSGRWWLRRIGPFLSSDEAIMGVAAIFTDITDGKHASQALAQDLKDTQLLRDLALRQVPEDNLATACRDVLSAAVAITRADAGTVQMVDDATGELVLLASHGVGDAAGVPDPKGDLRAHVEEGLLSEQSTPLVTRAGKVIGMISTHWRRHHRSSEHELRFLDLLARQAADLIERTRAAKALHESEERYRNLFNSIDEAFCIIEVLFDAAGKAVDYRYVEVNPSFEIVSGIKRAAGRRMREIAPGHEERWFEIYGRVAMTGEPLRFEHRADPMGDRTYDLYAFRVGDPGSRRVAVLFTDISERRRSETALRVSEERYRLLAGDGRVSVLRAPGKDKGASSASR